MEKTVQEKNIPVTVLPDAIAEFLVSQKDCFRNYRKAVSNNVWVNQRQMLKIQEKDFHPVYVPCALFDVHVSGDVILSGRRSVECKDKTTVSWFRTKTKLNISYEKVMISLAKGIASRKIRVDRKELTDYTPEKAAQAEILPAEGTQVTQARKAEETIAAAVGDIVLQYMDNKFQDISYKHVTRKILSPLTTAEYSGEALISAWIATYGKGKRKYNIIVNGNTGDVWLEHIMNPRCYLNCLYYPLFAFILLLVVLISITGWKPETWITIAALVLPAILIGVYAYGKKQLERSEPYGVQNKPQNRHITIQEHRCIRTRTSTDADD